MIPDVSDAALPCPLGAALPLASAVPCARYAVWLRRHNRRS